MDVEKHGTCREDDQDLSDEGEDMTNEIKFIDKTADVKRREQAMSSAELDERIGQFF